MCWHRHTRHIVSSSYEVPLCGFSQKDCARGMLTKKKLNLYFGVIIGVFFFGLINYAKAADYVDQSNWFDNTNTTCLGNGTGGCPSNFFNYICQSFVPIKGNITAASFMVARNSSYAAFVCDNPPRLRISANSCGDATILGSVTLTREECLNRIATTTLQLVTFNLPTPLALNNGQTYYLSMDIPGSGSTGNTMTARFNSTDSYFSGVGYSGTYNPPTRTQKGIPYTTTQQYNNGDFVFNQIATDNYISTTTLSTRIFDPIDNYTADISIWNEPFTFKAFVPTLTSGNVEFQFALFPSTTSTSYTSISNWIPSGNYFNATTTFLDFVTGMYQFPITFENGTYAVKARARFPDYLQETDWSQQINFTVTGTNYYLTCDLGDIGCYFQNAMTWAFIPQYQSFATQSWNSIIATMENKAPFGYISEIRNNFYGLNTSTATTTLGFTIDLPGPTATSSIPFVMSGFSNSGIVHDTFRPIFTYIIWIIVIIGLYETIKHFWLSL